MSPRPLLQAALCSLLLAPAAQADTGTYNPKKSYRFVTVTNGCPVVQRLFAQVDNSLEVTQLGPHTLNPDQTLHLASPSGNPVKHDVSRKIYIHASPPFPGYVPDAPNLRRGQKSLTYQGQRYAMWRATPTRDAKGNLRITLCYNNN